MTSRSSIDLERLNHVVEDDATVIAYLKRHPDFFNRNPALLSELRISHPSGVAVSLIERQVAILRQQNEKLEARIHELISIAHENDDISWRVHQLSLKIMECRGFEQAITAIRHSLAHEFTLDTVAMRIVGEYKGEAQLPLDMQQLFVKDRNDPVLKSLLQYQEPVCGRLKNEQLRYLFGDDTRIQSMALLPLGFGVVALGSSDSKRFVTNMATHFLRHLAELIARKIRHDIHVIG